MALFGLCQVCDRILTFSRCRYGDGIEFVCELCEANLESDGGEDSDDDIALWSTSYGTYEEDEPGDDEADDAPMEVGKG